MPSKDQEVNRTNRTCPNVLVPGTPLLVHIIVCRKQRGTSLEVSLATCIFFHKYTIVFVCASENVIRKGYRDVDSYCIITGAAETSAADKAFLFEIIPELHCAMKKRRYCHAFWISAMLRGQATEQCNKFWRGENFADFGSLGQPWQWSLCRLLYAVPCLLHGHGDKRGTCLDHTELCKTAWNK